MNNKIGLGIITCNREALFRECISNLPDVDCMIIVNDGKRYRNVKYPESADKIIQHRLNKGVAKSKNEIFRYMLDADCEHIFIMEDDVKIIDKDVCNYYIKASEITGLKHFNFAYHGPKNKKLNGEPDPIVTIDYGHGVKLALHKNLYAAFSYYHRDVLNKVGLMDERFHNFYEHVDHTYHISLAGFHPSFLWFPDISNSYECIMDLDPNHLKSSIRKNKWLYSLRYRYYSRIFARKNSPVRKVESQDEIIKELNEIKRNYGKIKVYE